MALKMEGGRRQGGRELLNPRFSCGSVGHIVKSTTKNSPEGVEKGHFSNGNTSGRPSAIVIQIKGWGWGRLKKPESLG